MKSKLSTSKGAYGGLSNALISIMIAVIIGVSVTITVVQDTLNQANFNGTLATVTNIIPVLIGVILIVAVTSVITGQKQ